MVLAAESSLGDPVLGGVVVREGFNVGSVKFRPRTIANGRWWDMSTGVSMEGERPGSGPWMRFPTADIGVDAWGLFLLTGGYVDALNGHRWEAFASRYFGADVPGFGTYVTDLEEKDARYTARLETGGYA